MSIIKKTKQPMGWSPGAGLCRQKNEAVLSELPGKRKIGLDIRDVHSFV
jgi:hypothetical protein